MCHFQGKYLGRNEFLVQGSELSHLPKEVTCHGRVRIEVIEKNGRLDSKKNFSS